MNVVSFGSGNSHHLQIDNNYYGQQSYYPSYIHGHESIEQDPDREYWNPQSPSLSPGECRYYSVHASDRYYNLDSGGYIPECPEKDSTSQLSQSYGDELYGTYNSSENIQGEFCGTSPGYHEISQTDVPVIRGVKRRNTANKKERRRTQSINNAFADLRECIPNVPADTKLSKIKTLRLATSYIGYLMGVLENEDCGDGFKADLSSHGGRRSTSDRRNVSQADGRKAKGRTGWPQEVWVNELKQESL